MKDNIIIGTWPLSGDFGAVERDQVSETLERSVSYGLTSFDTAPNYGSGSMEAKLGEMLPRNPAITIHTKIGNRPSGGKSFAIKDMEDSINQSIERLGTTRLGYVFLHNPRSEIEDYSIVHEMFDRMEEEEIIFGRGLSCARNIAYEDLTDLSEFDVVQDDHNLLRSSPYAGDYRYRFLARSPLASGLLGGHITPETKFEAIDHRSGWLTGKRLSALCAQVEAIRHVNPDIPLPSLARRAVIDDPGVSAIITGVRRPEHIDQLIADEQFSLSLSDIERLRSSAQEALTGMENMSY